MEQLSNKHIISKALKFLRKAGVCFIAGVFFASGIAFPAEGIVEGYDAGSFLETSAADGQYSHLDVETFTLPSHLGEVRHVHRGHSDRIVIHVQDAHCNYFAQSKIADIIGYLNREYGVNMLNLEGGAGEYDISVFTNISGAEIRREVAEYFVKRGEVNGAEFYAINNPDDVRLWGIEDRELYLNNLKVYRDSLSYKAEVDRYLSELRHTMNNLKRHIFSPELLKIDTAYNTYKAGNMEFKEYLDFLIYEARSRGISVKKYPNLYLIAQAMEKEEDVDFRRANAERSVLVDRIKGILSRSEMDELVSKTVAFRTKRIAVQDFYDYLLRKARECGFETSDYPALSSYIVYVSLFAAVDSFHVMEELDALEEEIKEPLYRNDTERELNLLSRNLALMGNIFELLLTKNDYAYYRDNEHSFQIHNFLRFIEREAPKYRITSRPSREVTRLDRYREEITRFYEISFKRDEAFVRNMRFAPASDGREAALIMTGGFHTENLSRIFQREGYSYVSIMPKFTSEEDYDNPYFALLAGQTADVQQMLRSALAESAMLQIASFLNRELADVFYGPDDANAFEALVGVVAFLRSRDYFLDSVTIRNIERDSSGTGLSVEFTHEGARKVELIPWQALGLVGAEDLRPLKEMIGTLRSTAGDETLKRIQDVGEVLEGLDVMMSERPVMPRAEMGMFLENKFPEQDIKDLEGLMAYIRGFSAEDMIGKILDLRAGVIGEDVDRKSRIISAMTQLGLDRDISGKIMDYFDEAFKEVIKQQLEGMEVSFLRDDSERIIALDAWMMEVYELEDLGLIVKFPKRDPLSEGKNIAYHQVFLTARNDIEEARREVADSLSMLEEVFAQKGAEDPLYLEFGRHKEDAETELSRIAQENVGLAYEVVRSKLGGLFAPLIIQDLKIKVETIVRGETVYEEVEIPYAIVQHKAQLIDRETIDVYQREWERRKEKLQELLATEQELQDMQTGLMARFRSRGQIQQKEREVERIKQGIRQIDGFLLREDGLLARFNELLVKMAERGIVDRDLGRYSVLAQIARGFEPVEDVMEGYDALFFRGLRNNYGQLSDGSLIAFDGDNFAPGEVEIDENGRIVRISDLDEKLTVLVRADEREDLPLQRRRELAGMFEEFNERHQDVWAPLPESFENIATEKFGDFLRLIFSDRSAEDQRYIANFFESYNLPKDMDIPSGIRQLGEEGVRRLVEARVLGEEIEPPPVSEVPFAPTGDGAGNIASGLSPQEEARWRAEAGISKASVSGSTVNLAKDAADSVLSGFGESIEKKLAERGVSQEEVERVIGMLEVLSGRRPAEDLSEEIGWMRTRVELVRGEEKYLLGNESALAVDIIDFLDNYKDISDPAPEAKEFLLEEYILHEVLENTSMDHSEVIEFTTHLFGLTGYEGLELSEPGTTPLGKALRAFLDVKLATSAGQDLISQMRSWDAPGVVFVPVSKKQMGIEEASARQRGIRESRRHLFRQHGTNIYELHYDMEEPDPGTVIKDMIESIPQRDRDHPMFRITVWSPEEKKAGIEKALKEYGDNLAGVLPGDFSEAGPTDRHSRIMLVLAGMGFNERARTEGRTKRDVEESLSEFLARMSADPRVVREDIRTKFGNNHSEFIRALIAGDYILRIQRVNFEEIRDFMEAEAAVLRSL